MTDEEFQRLKEAEKKHLRAKKRLQRTLKALKQRNEVQGVMQRMKQGAARLLNETGSLVDSLRRSVAQDQARVEGTLHDEIVEDEDLHAAEEELREERAEELVRRMKAEEQASSRPDLSVSSDEASSGSDGTDDSEERGPDKTIGRMGDLRPDDS